MKRAYNLKDYCPNRRVSLASGAIIGRPAPLPPLERYQPPKTRYQQSQAYRERMQVAARLGWERRRANVSP